MRSFDDIYAIAAKRKGGVGALETLIANGGFPSHDIHDMTDDRWLAVFTRHVFNAGFNWKVVEAKWPGFEAAFDGFDVARCAMMDDDWLDALLKDDRIIRNGAKIQSVRDNAVLLRDLAADRGSASQAIADWPDSDFVGLLDLLKTRGGRLGGTTAQYALRHGGKSGFILSRDVVARLVAEGVIDKAPGSKSAMAKVQAAFDAWQAQSGRPLGDISRVLALSL